MASTAKPDKQLAKLDGLLDKAVLAVPPPRDNLRRFARCTTVATTQRGTVPPTRDPRAAGERHHRSRRRWSARARVRSSSSGSPCDFAASDHRCSAAVTPSRRVRRLCDFCAPRGG